MEYYFLSVGIRAYREYRINSSERAGELSSHMAIFLLGLGITVVHMAILAI